jgi:2-oxo-3-hexenedioate decarboxylase
LTIAAAHAVRVLSNARRDGYTIEPFSFTDSAITESWGYAAQDLDRQNRIADGESLVVDTPIVGFLTDAMMFEAARVSSELHRWVQPRIEPEIVFVTARDISTPIAVKDAAALVDSVCIGAEIIDSRYTGFRFGLGDVIADNTSAAGVVLGAPHDLDGAGDLASLRCVVEVDGVVVHEAFGSAILGDPIQSVILLSEHLAARGETLPAGSVVLAGAMTDAVPLAAGRSYSLGLEGLGALNIRT